MFLQPLISEPSGHLTLVQTELSLSKLALLACGPEEGAAGDMGELNRELSVIEYQRNIPQCVLEVGQGM